MFGLRLTDLHKVSDLLASMALEMLTRFGRGRNKCLVRDKVLS